MRATTPPAPIAIPPTTAPPTGATVAPRQVVLPEELALVTSRWTTDWSRRTIELEELLIGILSPDPRDVIRPLDGPPYETVDQAAEWLEDRELGILFEIQGVTRFYPLRILTAHEVVNDEVNGFPYVVTYCPLCNTAVAFPREVDGRVLRFGVSGLLRNSDLVMWDDLTTSLWQQTTGEGIVGDFAGTQLEFIPTALVRWGGLPRSPTLGARYCRRTPVFRSTTGVTRTSGTPAAPGPFPVCFPEGTDDRYRALERVVGVRVGDEAKAYPFSVISQKRAVNDVVGGKAVTVWWGATDAADALDANLVAEGVAIGTGVAYLPVVDGRVLTFTAVDDTLFTDAETGSSWNILGMAIDGPLAGAELDLAVHQNEFWFAWAAFNDGSPVYGEIEGCLCSCDPSFPQALVRIPAGGSGRSSGRRRRRPPASGARSSSRPLRRSR